MPTFRLLITVGVVAASLTFCVGRAPRPAPASPLPIVFTANRQGEIEPCGCQINQIGGMNRLQAFLEKQGTGPRLFVDAGDTFFSSRTLSVHRRAQEVLRAQVIAESYRELGLDVFTPGDGDFAAGLPFLRALEKASGAVFVSANLTDTAGQPIFAPYHIVEKAGWRVAVIGISGEEAMAFVPEVKVTPAAEALSRVLPGLKADAVIVLSHSGLKQDRELARPGIDVIVGAHSQDVLTVAPVVGRTILVQPHNEGQQIGLLALNPADRLKSEHRLVDLGKELDVDNSVARRMRAYHEELRRLALKDEARGPTSRGQHALVANPQQCRTCHQKQYDFWQTTKHASAYLVLYAKNQHFDPECIACHSLGFQDKHGFQKIALPLVLKPESKTPAVETLMKKVFEGDSRKPLDSRTDPKRYEALKKRYHAELKKLDIASDYMGVQCEHCHGSRHGHPGGAAPTLKKVNESSCRTCHVPPNAPEFDPKSMLKVACPSALTGMK